jgi:hypothetical protein
VLRYRGLVPVSIYNAADYPQTNGSIPADSPITQFNLWSTRDVFTAWVRFALFDPGANPLVVDPVAVANPLRRLPEFVYDDNQLAAVSPHAPVPSVPSVTPGINATDLDIGARTWAQNLYVTAVSLDGLVVIADTPGRRVLLDVGPDSGLGFNTGLPVVAVEFVFFAAQGEGGGLQGVNLDVTFEIRHSASR